jgi:eukaryotic-like serine/threonine-protein kinase
MGASLAEPSALVGCVLAERYRIEARIGGGAMGAVYRAQHVKIKRRFAVKVLHAELIANPKMRARFMREADLAGTLRHPNIVGIVDVGETPEGQAYIVMEYAEGPTLAQLIASGPLAARRVVALAAQLCDGLYHAHEQGLVHRDFKPDNIVVEHVDDVERPRIVDFGLAVLHDAPTGRDSGGRLTTAGVVIGTPRYMAPEQARDADVDNRTDLYALGVVMFEMLCGVPPFAGSGVEVARAHVAEPVPRCADRAPGVAVPGELEAIVRRLLAKAPDERPANARQVRAQLVTLPLDGAALARPVTPLPAPPPSALATFTSAPTEPIQSAELTVTAAPQRGSSWLPIAILALAALLAAVVLVATLR